MNTTTFHQVTPTIDMFSGAADAIYHRLCAVCITDEAGGDQVFPSLKREILRLMCLLPKDPPRSFAEVEQRMSAGWLLDTFRRIQTKSQLQVLEESGAIERFTQEIHALARTFGGIVDPKG